MVFRVALPVAEELLADVEQLGGASLPIVASKLSHPGCETPWGIHDASVIVLSLPLLSRGPQRLTELSECSA